MKEEPPDGPRSQPSIRHLEQAQRTSLCPAGIPDPRHGGNQMEQLFHTAQIRGNRLLLSFALWMIWLLPKDLESVQPHPQARTEAGWDELR